MGFRQRGDCGKDKEDMDMRKGVVVVKNYPLYAVRIHQQPWMLSDCP